MFKIYLTRDAEATYRWLQDRDFRLWQRIRLALDGLRTDPRQGKLLKGAFRGDYSLRVGSYRIIYTVEHRILTVIVIDIGHRREIYR
ncbi:MAG: type II toxin-antitoxin system RelE/ParE family toxin [Elusimicrobia bacterium]|nr:type II toxin-antitoxin system RelE/ParE family toxin [Elusimicrobiota bacterium]